MPSSWELFGEDTEDAALKLLQRTRGMSLGALGANDVLFGAVLRNLQVIGEAVKRIPPGVRSMSTAVVAPLREMERIQQSCNILADPDPQLIPWKNQTNLPVATGAEAYGAQQQ